MLEPIQLHWLRIYVGVSIFDMAYALMYLYEGNIPGARFSAMLSLFLAIYLYYRVKTAGPPV